VRDPGGFHAVGDIQLGEDVGHMHAGGLGADEQGLADLPVGASRGQVPEHLQLTGGEAESLD
jgi:hypothetical protein